jgi:5-bromo-4-chloroindolyl phosphate hydrolysis protein
VDYVIFLFNNRANKFALISQKQKTVRASFKRFYQAETFPFWHHLKVCLKALFYQTAVVTLIRRWIESSTGENI